MVTKRRKPQSPLRTLRTDEATEAVSALRMAEETLVGIARSPHRWKWTILALHSAVQGFMVLALRGSNGLAVMTDDSAAAWLTAHEAQSTTRPPLKLDSFLNLYDKVKGGRMLQFVHSKKFRPTGTQGASVKRLNHLRNQFVHFQPQGWRLEVSGMPRLCLDCAALIRFLGWESGNVFWDGKRIGVSATACLSRLERRLTRLREQCQG